MVPTIPDKIFGTKLVRKIKFWYLLLGILEFADSGRKCSGPWTVDAGLWTLDSGRWTLDTGLWTLDSGPSLIKLMNILWVRISKDHGHNYSVEIVGSDVAIIKECGKYFLL